MDSTTYSNTQYFIDLENEFGANNYKHLDGIFAQGKGVWVWDVKAHKYLDGNTELKKPPTTWPRASNTLY